MRFGYSVIISFIVLTSSSLAQEPSPENLLPSADLIIALERIESRLVPNTGSKTRNFKSAAVKTVENLNIEISSEDIIALQNALKGRGYLFGPISGEFDDATRQSIAAYQRATGQSEINTLTDEFINSLGIAPADWRPPDNIPGTTVVSGRDPNKTVIYQSELELDVPFVEPTIYLLLLRPNVTSQDIDDLKAKFGFEIIETEPDIGLLTVRKDLSYLYNRADGDTKNAAIAKGIDQATRRFKEDPRILAAPPETLLRVQDFSRPTNVRKISSEIADWGLMDTQIAETWNKPGAKNGAVFGVVETGFARHSDLIYSAPPQSSLKLDHPTHVLGIACASHNNFGTRGVLPNCFGHALEFTDYYSGTSEDPLDRRSVSFSAALKIILRLMENETIIRTINISLAYNFMDDFNVNPFDPEDDDDTTYSPGRARSLVEEQGIIAEVILERASEFEKVIFSAAGNDSLLLDTPMDASYASPFNWAALRRKKMKNDFTGVVVEAHDDKGSRANFSNIGGNISCPGVGIISPVAHDERGISSEEHFGEMSGTSMATPYCAAAHTLFLLVRPKYRVEEAVHCLFMTEAISSSSVPRLRLSDALKNCPRKA